jgi:hypothetical protein
VITVLTPIPNRAAAARRDNPSTSTARITRSRKSIEYGRAMQAGLHIQPILESKTQHLEKHKPTTRLNLIPL